MSEQRLNRRRFVKSMAAASIAGPAIVSLARAGETAANDRINLAVIGNGMMGRGHLNNFLGYDDVQVVAICDVVRERLEHGLKTVEDRYAKKKERASYKGCDGYKDFRDVLARKDIDAVLIATPDHWHATQAAMAAAAKKDIYCEKPLTQNIVEGRQLVEAIRRNQVIFQTGSQQRSEFGGKFRTAVEMIWNGRIGKVKTIRIGVGGPAVACDLPEEPVPDGTDWNMWQGPAPVRGFNEILCPQGIHRHFPAFRKYREYAGGALADMGAHHFDIAQWALGMDKSGPVKIEPPDGDTTSGLKFTYANGVEMYHGGPSDCMFEGELGTIFVGRRELRSDPEGLITETLGEDARRVYPSTNHRRNWIECIKSRKLPICDVETGHRTSTICQLGNIGYWLRRPLKWDPEKETFDDPEANALRHREPRAPWVIAS